MNEEDYYSFLSEEDEEGNAYYGFITNNKFVYELYFKVDEYTEYVENYPFLLEEGYAFGFRRKKPTGSKKIVKDPMVFTTIYKIIIDFFQEKGKNTILLYHCDDNDGKHHGRNKLFNLWDELVKENTSYEKYSLEIDVPDKKNKEKTRNVYLGYILSRDNPNSEKVSEEFEDFSVALIRPKDEEL